jgi:hypothetical protein
MRGFAPAVIATVLLAASAGWALGIAAPVAEPTARAALAPASEPPAAGPRQFVADFPNCPAPAVNGMNLRTVKTAGVAQLTVFVVVQNVGQRAFFASPGQATLAVSLGERELGRFDVEKLTASEVRFFSVEAEVPAGANVADLVATLSFSPGARTGKVEGTLDCQTSDNRAVRRGPSIRASLERASG